MPPLETVLIVEALAYGCSAIQLCIMGPSLAAAPVNVAGNEEQKKKYLGMLTAEPTIAVSSQEERNTIKTERENEMFGVIKTFHNFDLEEHIVRIYCLTS